MQQPNRTIVRYSDDSQNRVFVFLICAVAFLLLLAPASAQAATMKDQAVDYPFGHE